jgi:hypothetical protein
MSPEVITQLVANLGSIGKEVWAMAERQALINACWNTAWVLLSVSVLMVIVTITRRLWKTMHEDRWWVLGTAVFIGSFPLIGFFSSLIYLVTYLLNPQYAALSLLLVRGK